MIPKKLRIKNFSSYGDAVQELDFGTFHTACLTGENGAGKSSLIESILWCIWGRWRIRDKRSNDGVMHEGAGELRVDFEFLHNGVQYKISRQGRLTKKNKLEITLDFAQWNSETSDYKPLTKQGKETQAHIDEVVRIDYDSFVSSVFLRQGASGEFTEKKPAERKDVLSKILGLERYETLSEAAKDKTRNIKTKLENTEITIGLLEKELLQKPTAEKWLTDALTQITTLETDIAALDAELESFASRLTELQQQDAERQAKQNELLALERDLQSAVVKLKKKQESESELARKLTRKADIESRKARYDALIAELDTLEQKRNDAQKKDADLRARRDALLRRESELTTKAESERKQQNQIEKEIRLREDKLRRKEDTLKKHTDLSRQIQSQKQSFDELPKLIADKNAAQDAAKKAEAQLELMKTQLEQIKTRATTLKDSTEPNCPVCHTKLDEKHKTEIVDEYRKEYANLNNESKKLASEQIEYHALYQQLEKNVAMMQRREKLITEDEGKLAVLVTELRQLEEIEKELTGYRVDQTRTQAARQTLLDELAALQTGDDKKAVQELESELAALGYDETRFQKIRAEQKSLETAQSELAELAAAETALTALRQELGELHHELTWRTEKRDALNHDLQTLVSAAKEREQLQNFLRVKQDQRNAQQKSLNDATARKLRAESELESLAKKESEKTTLESSIAAERESVEIHKKLAEAFGKDGIQNMLFEAAAPEISLRANEILQRLTRNQFSLAVRTTKELKSGKVEEALDIDISDSSGTTRLYETFSGGEKFRIDFALRIALSETLAQQKGTSVQMLVIDEGFGTQDAEGIDVMIDAITEISDRFEKVILITHLEKLQDSFETRINISKDALQGSRFKVVHAS
jgi:DNA repair protein SbcC/Rad50